MANTSFNPSDKSASITLSNANLTAVTSSSGYARAIDRQLSGKYYFEFTWNVAPLINSTVGVATGAATGAGSPTAAGNPFCIGLSSTGTGSIWQNGAQLVSNLGTIASGTVMGLALDLSFASPNLMGAAWWRVGAAGNWNGNASNSPVSGVGGIPLWGPGIPVYPHTWLAQNGNQVTANFGDSAFTGAVPSGYTSGFTSAATPTLSAIETQSAIEEWANAATVYAELTQLGVEAWGQAIPPAMWLSQIGAEVWATPTGPTTRMIMSQLGIEVWASARARPPQLRSIIMA